MTQSLPAALLDYMHKAPIALSLGALDQPDTALVAVNDAFCRLTGYARDDVLGRNCRFLQPETPDLRDIRARMRRFLDDPSAEAGRFEVPNRRADGTPFTNLVFLSRLRSTAGSGGLIFASQFDLTSARSDTAVRAYDARLGRSIDDVAGIGADHGLMMRQSAELLSQSAATIANLRLHE